MNDGLLVLIWLLVTCLALGFIAGTWIADRFNRRRKNAQAELGEQFAKMLEDHRKSLVFANEHVTIQTEYKFTTSGHRYTMTLAAKPVQLDLEQQP